MPFKLFEISFFSRSFSICLVQTRYITNNRNYIFWTIFFLKNKHRFVQTQKNMASVNHRYFLGKRKKIPKRFFLKTLVFHTYQDTEVYVCLFVCLYVSNFPSPPPKKMCFVNRSNYLSKINKLPNTIPPPLLVFFWYFAHRYSLGILAIFVRLWVGRVCTIPIPFTIISGA